jgi:hypothetical protein
MVFFQNERRYEMIFVAMFMALIYILWRQEKIRRTEQAEQISQLIKDSAGCEERLIGSQAAFDLRLQAEALKSEQKVGMLHATILNMHADLILFAGGRAMGSLEFDAGVGSYRYTRAPHGAPPDGKPERRRPKAR